MARLKLLLSAPSLIVLALVVCALYSAKVGYELIANAGLNRSLSQIETITVEDNSPPLLLIGKANWLDRQGQTEEAIRLLHRALSRADQTVKSKISYNLGTLYLREASKNWNRSGVWAYSRVLTLLTLARDHLRESLRLDPANLDARYHLEYALRITLPPREREASKWHGNKTSVFATVPGIPKGNP